MKVIVIIWVLIFSQNSFSGTVTGIEKASLQKKYANILGTYVTTDLLNVKYADAESIGEIKPVITQTKIIEENGEYKLALSHWVLGKVETTLKLPIMALDKGRVYKKDGKSIWIDSENGERIKIMGQDNAKEIEKSFAQILIFEQQLDTIRLIDPYVYKNEYYSGFLHKINDLPGFSPDGNHDRSSIMRFLQVQLQNNGVKPDVPATDFIKGHYKRVEIGNSCRLAFN